MNEEIYDKLKKVLDAARLVVPTSEDCPLIKALEALDEAVDEEDAIRFKRAWESK